MKTIKLIYVMMLAGGIILSSCSNSGQQQKTENSAEKPVGINGVKINPITSNVMWKGEMLGVYTHTGTLALYEADISIENGQITGGSFTVDMKSITPTDDNYNPEEGNTQEKLVGHLSSPDFFDVENFPTAKFVISDLTGTTANGILTVRGISHEEKVENVNLIENEGLVTISGELVFDRKKYDVAWDSPMKDMILSDDIVVSVELTGEKG